MFERERTLRPVVEELFLPGPLRDDALRMMFSCCHPRLHEDVKVTLILNILCGFGVNEIASAFLTSSGTKSRSSETARNRNGLHRGGRREIDGSDLLRRYGSSS